MTMPLSQIEFPLTPEEADSLSCILEEEALSTSWYERTPEAWIFQVLVETDKMFHVKHCITEFFEGSPPPLTIQPVPKEDWVAAVYRDFPPLTIGRFYVYGSHIEKDPQGLIPLHIDAATAFGSGQHESTEGCLRALTLLSEQPPFHHSLDMGCGSGILALAMASLWKAPVLACDNDPESVRVTLENARINHLENVITSQVSEGFSTILGRKFDIITANILAGPLCQMSGDLSQALMPVGYVILAGLLNRQAEDVIDAYRSVGVKLVEQLFIGDWSTLIMRKENND